MNTLYFFYPLIHERLDCFHFLATVINTAMNIHACVIGIGNNTYFISLGNISGVELLNDMEIYVYFF